MQSTSPWTSFVFVLFAAVASSVLLFGCDRQDEAIDEGSEVRAGKVIRVSLQPIPAYAPLWIAKEKGWLDEELATLGFADVDWSVMRDGPVQNEAFVAGRLDVALMGDTPAIIARAAGLDTRIISIASVSPQSLAILVPADAQTASVADLKGKKVATTKGSFAHHLLALALADKGLKLSDIQFIHLPAPEINTSLTTRQIDAGVTWEPYISQATGSGASRVLIDGTGLKRGDEVIVATHAFASAQPDAVAALLRVYKRGAEFIVANPKEAAGLIAADVSMTSEQLVDVFAKTDFAPGLGDADVAELRKSEAFLRENGITRKPLDVTTLADPTYANDAGLKR